MILSRRKREAENLSDRYQFALTHDLKIVFIDEVKFGSAFEFKSLRAWQAPKDKLTVKDSVVDRDNISVFAALDHTGIIYFEFIDGKYDAKNYMGILTRLYQRLGKTNKVAIFYDGLMVHCKIEVI
jgi:hypothetical protein